MLTPVALIEGIQLSLNLVTSYLSASFWAVEKQLFLQFKVFVSIFVSIFNFFLSLLLELPHIGGAIMVDSMEDIGFVPAFTPLYPVLLGFMDILNSVITYFFFVRIGGRPRELLEPETAALFPFDGMAVYLFFRSIYTLDFGLADMEAFLSAASDHIFALWDARVHSSLIAFTFDLFLVVSNDFFYQLVALSFMDIYLVTYYLYGIEL